MKGRERKENQRRSIQREGFEQMNEVVIKIHTFRQSRW